MEKAYRIITIEEEMVPLAGSVSGGYFNMTITAMVLAALSIMLVLYLGACIGKRNRIKELGGNPIGWNLRRLGEAISTLENARIDSIEM